jgi:uncharacterized protein YkwD
MRTPPSLALLVASLAGVAGAASGGAACAPSAASRSRGAAPVARSADRADPATEATDPASVAAAAWAPVTQSPWPRGRAGERDADARAAALAALCGPEDGALAGVARELVALRARGLGAPDAEAVVARLRAAGEPYVRPRIIFATGRAPLDDTKIKAALGTRPERRGHARCGVAIEPLPHGGEVLVALRVDALADLSPLPTRARTGEWLSFEARLHVDARAAKLVVLGPRGAPRTVPTSLDTATGLTHARFALDQPGAFTLQLVADLEEGPRPLLEARVFADTPPTPPGEEAPAPGEEEGEDAAALARMIASLRALEGSPPLARDAKLDALARAHAERMRDRRSVAHDLGDGDFRDRFEAEGTLDARAIGENVAHAPTVALAHRALHASPSHRINLLRADYTFMGVGVAQAEDGSVYVCETFAATVRPISPR